MVVMVTDKAMELEGNLGTFQLPDILRFLAMGRMNGVLSVIGRERTIAVTIKEGLITGVSSGERFPRLGQMLIYEGLISRKVLDEVLESQRDGGNSQMLGEILIERGLVAREKIESALHLQIREELWDLFSWSDGTFKFEHGLKPVMGRSLLALEIEPLIVEGLEQMDQWRVIAGNLGDPRMVFRVTSELAALPQARLTVATWRVLALINGRHSIQVLIYLSGMGRFETLRALDKLLSLQLIAPVAAPGRVRDGEPGGGGLVPPGQAVAEVEDAEDDGRLRGLFRRRRPAGRAQASEMAQPEGRRESVRAGSFLTGVGLACDMISRLAGRLASEPEMRAESGPAGLLDRLWRDIGMRFPRADLIVPCQGRLDPGGFEAYVKLAGGLADPLVGCYEDSLEMLAQIGGSMACLARERLGERAHKIILEVITPYGAGGEIKYPGEFLPRVWAERWSETGA